VYSQLPLLLPLPLLLSLLLLPLPLLLLRLPLPLLLLLTLFAWSALTPPLQPSEYSSHRATERLHHLQRHILLIASNSCCSCCCFQPQIQKPAPCPAAGPSLTTTQHNSLISS